MKKMVFLLSVMTITLLGYCQGTNKDGLLTYLILKEKVSDTQIKTQVELRILITDTNITEQRIRELLTYLYTISINRTGFKYSSNPTNVFIYAYTSKEKFESGFQWIGMIAKGYYESNPVLSISDIQMKSLTLKPANRLGLAEKARVEIPIAKLKEYKIKISAINLGERKVRINITTNFPDGTNLFLSSYRIYHTKGDTVAHCGDLPEKVFSVKDGKFETIIIIDDTEWYNRYQGVSKIFPSDFPPLSKISDKITINVMYTAARDQPANVTEILGTHGEFVTGKGSEQFGTGTAGRLTFLSASKELYFPMEGRVEKNQNMPVIYH